MPATLDELNWLSGYWTGVQEEIRMEELWLPASGRLMPGVHRDIDPLGKTFFEFLRIESTDTGLVYLASPAGKPAIAFPSCEIGERRVVFENLKHDYPQRILYWREGNRLHARIEGMVDNVLKAHEWVWTITRFGGDL